jgi:hypothetical protein
MERDEQKALFEWAARLERQRPELAMLFAIPNSGGYKGGFRSNARIVAEMKRQGLKPGVPDVCLPVARRGFHGLYIEMKTDKGKATENQLDWIAALISQNYLAVICRGWDEARAVIEEYLG